MNRDIQRDWSEMFKKNVSCIGTFEHKIFLIFTFQICFSSYEKKISEHFYSPAPDFSRSDCPKCGATGKVENVSYRYKLSIKVAESNKLFGITIFGSCLDAFFGLTATDLHR